MINYEEALKTIDRLINEKMGGMGQLGALHKLQDIIIEQHRPPTFEEVVKAWEDAYPITHDSNRLLVERLGGVIFVKLFDETSMIEEVIDKVSIYGIHLHYGVQTKISTKRLEAAITSIRYLQSQKEQDHE